MIEDERFIVDNTILDLNAKFWFEDAYVSLKEGVKFSYERSENNNELNINDEIESWMTFKAKGNRY